MDSLANYSAADRQVYFEEAAARLGRLTPQLIEKDFWVCWILKRLFEMEEVGKHLTFKGGTSLSKVFNLIERFSEDVDLAIEREWLGFGGDQEPEAGASGKEQQRRVEKLRATAQEAIANRILPTLRSLVSRHLSEAQDWDLSLSPDDRDQQTILFRFPSLTMATSNPYIAPSVKLELGARSDHFPVSEASITPYLHDALPGVCSHPLVRVRVLGAERTFWEKGTILHSLHHLPMEKPFPLRHSRHYYDLYQLAESPVEGLAMSRLDLLERVAAHKQVFFKSSWARYSEASRVLCGSFHRTKESWSSRRTTRTCSRCSSGIRPPLTRLSLGWLTWKLPSTDWREPSRDRVGQRDQNLEAPQERITRDNQVDPRDAARKWIGSFPMRASLRHGVPHYYRGFGSCDFGFMPSIILRTDAAGIASWSVMRTGPSGSSISSAGLSDGASGAFLGIGFGVSPFSLSGDLSAADSGLSGSSGSVVSGGAT